MRTLRVAALTIGGFLVFAAGNAQAGAVGEVLWNGAEFTIEYVDDGTADDFYDFVLTANFAEYDGSGGHTDYLMGVNFKPSEGDLVGIDVFPADHLDPCELRFSDFGELAGRRLPRRWKVVHGTTIFAEFEIDEWEFE